MSAVLAGSDAATLVRASVTENVRPRTFGRCSARTAQPSHDPLALERKLRAIMQEWRSLLRTHVLQARQMLRKLVIGRIRFTPDAAERPCLLPDSRLHLGHIFEWVSSSTNGGVPRGFWTLLDDPFAKA